MTICYKPKDEPMRVVALFSGGASGAYDLLRSPHPKYQVVGGICKSADAKGIAKLGTEFPIPIVVYDIHAHHKTRNQKIKNNMGERAKYDSILENFLLAMRPDVLIGSGDMYLTTWCDFYPILNVHPADLNRVDENGNRLFTGDNAVLDAILYGETETRSTVHLMTGHVDGGPIVVRSAPLKVEQSMVNAAKRLAGKYEDARFEAKWMMHVDNSKVRTEAFRLDPYELDDLAVILGYAARHQSEMKTKCDTPAFKKALELVAEKGLHVEDDILHLGDEPLTQSGITISDCLKD
jgi:folate-dependent phosphoribosylglycinamide formyltransferase PurN